MKNSDRARRQQVCGPCYRHLAICVMRHSQEEDGAAASPHHWGQAFSVSRALPRFKPLPPSSHCAKSCESARDHSM